MGLSEDQILFLYNLYGFNNVVIEFSTNELTRYFKMGYRFCASHEYLVYTKDLLCGICRKKFRTTVRNPSKERKGSYSYGK